MSTETLENPSQSENATSGAGFSTETVPRASGRDERGRFLPRSATATGEPAGPPLNCPYCGFSAKNENGLRIHVGRKHPEEDLPTFHERPQPAPPPQPPAPGPIQLTVDLKELETTTARNLEGLSMLLHGALRGVKIARLQAQVRGHPTRVPPLDTHFPIALRNRAATVAHLLVEYAARNETVMRALRGFNALFEGGETASTIAALGIAALATLSAPLPPMVAGFTIPDVLQEVATENEGIAAQLQQEARERQAQQAQQNGARAA